MNNKHFFPYNRQSISEQDRKEVYAALNQTIITRGPLVEKFEQAITDYCGAKFAVAFNSGSSALSAAFYAANFGAGDKLLTTPNTFVSTIGGALHLRASPAFIDIDRDTGNLQLDLIENSMQIPLTRGKYGIIPVHFAGNPVDMYELDQKIKQPDSIVIEDAAHALGSTYKNGKRVGCCEYSQMTIFSFHPVKTITTGEGGMVTTNDQNLARRLRLYRNNGIERDPQYFENPPKTFSACYYEVQEITNNYNLTDFQAALGLSQLRRIDAFIEKRRKLASHYRKLLQDSKYIKLFSDQTDLLSACHLFVVQINFEGVGLSRAEVVEKLLQKGIGTQVHYIPLYRHPYFEKRFGEQYQNYPEMETYYSQALSLPLYYELTQENVEYICNSLKEILKTH